MARASVSKSVKSKLLVEIDEYLTYFNDRKADIESTISELQSNITKIKNDIKETESELKNKINDVAKRKKVVNSKLHDVNGDYNATHLLQAAEQLKILESEQSEVEERLNAQKSELQSILKEEENKKADAEKKKGSVEKIFDKAKTDLSEVATNYTDIIKAINDAISICDNNNLKMALDEEQANMRTRLGEITDSYIDEVDDILEINKSRSVLDSTEDLFNNKKIIKIEPEKEEPEITIEDIHRVTEFEAPKVSEEPKKIEIEIDEPKVEVPEESYDENRKVVDIKNISIDQKEAIENSSIVEKGLTNFFEKILK